MAVDVIETFFAIPIVDMDRAKRFYVDAFGAEILFTSPGWSSLRIAGVRVGLVRVPDSKGRRTGLHFGVLDIHGARAAVAQAGGHPGQGPIQVGPDVVIAEVLDTEGNTFTLRSS